jgi:hypothetical protein
MDGLGVMQEQIPAQSRETIVLLQLGAGEKSTL